MNRKNFIPTYGLHKGSGQARCYINGETVYLGKYGSKESRVKFAQIVAQAMSGLSIDPISVQNEEAEDCGPSVAELVHAFMEHAKTYYVDTDWGNGIPQTG